MLRKILAILAIALLGISLSGCGVQRNDENDKANVADLEARGFSEASLVDEGYESPTYSVTFGSCRNTVQKKGRAWVLSVVTGDGVATTLTDVNVSMIEANANELGLEYCFEKIN